MLDQMNVIVEIRANGVTNSHMFLMNANVLFLVMEVEVEVKVHLVQLVKLDLQDQLDQ
jgi:hypothetical protein